MDGEGMQVTNISQCSTLPKNLQPGYVLLADGGFDIKESSIFIMQNSELRLLLKVKEQLEGIDVESAKRIGTV